MAVADAVATRTADQGGRIPGKDYKLQDDKPRLRFKRSVYEPSIILPAPYQPETEFPVALSPTFSPAEISDLVAAIKRLSYPSTIRDLLTKHGAILFKDVNIQNASEFSEFATAFGWSAHEDIGNPVRRTLLAPNVATANEGPNTQPVYPHNEFGLSPHYPQYVFFYCVSAPETGGETPINSSIVLYEQLKETVPEFLDALEDKVIVLRRVSRTTARLILNRVFNTNSFIQTSHGTTFLRPGHQYCSHTARMSLTPTVWTKVEQKSKKKSGVFLRRLGNGKIRPNLISWGTSEFGRNYLVNHGS